MSRPKHLRIEPEPDTTPKDAEPRPRGAHLAIEPEVEPIGEPEVASATDGRDGRTRGSAGRRA